MDEDIAVGRIDKLFSPLAGIDLKEGRKDCKTFQFHKHYGWLYGNETENPGKWLGRNLGKVNAAVVSLVRTCDTMIKDSWREGTETKGKADNRSR